MYLHLLLHRPVHVLVGQRIEPSDSERTCQFRLSRLPMLECVTGGKLGMVFKFFPYKKYCSKLFWLNCMSIDVIQRWRIKCIFSCLPVSSKYLSQDEMMDREGTTIEFQKVSPVPVEYLSYFDSVFESNSIIIPATKCYFNIIRYWNNGNFSLLTIRSDLI